MSKSKSAGEPQAESTNLDYVGPLFSNLNKWFETHSSSSDLINKFCKNYSKNFSQYLIERKMLVQENFQKPGNDWTTAFISLDLQVIDDASKRRLYSSLLSKIEERKKILAEIEALEYGISSNIANDRINLLIQSLRDLLFYSDESLKLSNLNCHPNFCYAERIFRMDGISPDFVDRIPSFLELCWWVTISILDEIKSPAFRMLRVAEPILSSTHILIEILTDCKIKAELSIEKLPNPTVITDFSGKSVPMIVFSNADINSALDAAVNAAWFSEGLVPWASSCILVQEGIHLKFITSLKKRLQQSAVTIAITHTNLNNENELKENVEEILSRAKMNHLEIFQVAPTSGNRQPATLIIGDFVSAPLSLTAWTIDKTQPILFVVPFRKIQEGIAIANSSVEKIAASVWSESFSQCSSAVTQLDFGTIWVNSHGIFDSIVPFFSRGPGCEPYRPTGIDYYHWNKDLTFFGSVFTSANTKLPDAEIHNSLAVAYTEYLNWKEKDLHDYMEILNKVWEHIDPTSVPSNLRKQLVESLHAQAMNSASVQVKNCLVSSTIEPVGVIIFVIESELEPKLLLKNVLSAVFSRNTVIVVGKEIELRSLTSTLPKGVLNLTENFPLNNICSIVRAHKYGANVSVWALGGHYVRLYTRWDGDLLKYYQFVPDIDIRPHVSRKKVIWMPFS